ncbi:GPP34 family phosphoprotein [Streptomyces cellulosae]|uniref:GPP34 family phosphoprotein n=1 Tax=Streptomyces cellulosae TaxID=1968 RepID=A0ABW6JP84_STRCE
MQTDAGSGLAEDFLLAVYLDGQGRVPHYRTGLDFGLSAAMLMELALGGFIHTADGYIVADHGTDPRDPALREVLTRIRSSRTPRRTSEWVKTLSVNAHKQLSAGLITHGVLARAPRRLPLPTRPARRYNLLQPTRRDAALRSLNDPSNHSDHSDHSTAPAAPAAPAALAALASACEATPGGQEHSEPEAQLQSLSPTCRQILNAVTDCIQPLKYTWD